MADRDPLTTHAFEPAPRSAGEATGAARPRKNGAVPARRSASPTTGGTASMARPAGRRYGALLASHNPARWSPSAATIRARKTSASTPAATNASVRFSRSSALHVSGSQPASGELLRHAHARFGHPRVDAGDERLGNRLDAGAVARPVGGPVSVVLNPACRRVALHEVQPEHLRQAALHGPPPEVHLEEPVLRLHVALREKEIVFVARVDVRHAPPIAHDAHAFADAGERQRSGYDRQRSRPPGPPPSARAAGTRLRPGHPANISAALN